MRDELCVNTLRFLAVDAVEAAQSGHPGAPLGMAPMAYVIWDRFLRHNPRNPDWFNRDRFILSAGHASALLYALLHAYGYDLPVEELKRFRQWNSKTPGHPEHDLTPGVEATTGPLGQGFSMGVGMAIAERFLSAHFNRPGFPVLDHYTYAIVSDGDLMEGISSEAASLAGTLKLGKLVYLYDDNGISIEGSTKLAFTEDVGKRFEAYGWQVLAVTDGTDLKAIEGAISEALVDERPSLIRVKTHIGYGSPRQDTAAVHGEPLGPEATRRTKEALGWPTDEPFHVPEEARRHFQQAVERGERLEAEWQAIFDAYSEEHPRLAEQLGQALRGELPADWEKALPVFRPEDGPIATRQASGKVINALAERLDNLIGGSADLAPSTKTLIDSGGDFSAGHYKGRNLHFGVREHAMGAIVNGMALHGGVIPYGATFLVFSDYMRPALRLAALMKTCSIFVFTHDSIALGEDGPTHQPLEQLMSLRLIPGLTVLRPADANETAVAWKVAIEHTEGPVALALTRQKLPVLDPDRFPVVEGAPRGAYVLSEAEDSSPDVVLIATGSEVHLALEAQESLSEQGVRARIVSMPSWELYRAQPETYKREVLPPSIPKLAIEAGIALGWREIVGSRGDVIGLDRFGASAPGKAVYEKLGFTVENVVERALALLVEETS
jgi:transketolase